MTESPIKFDPANIIVWNGRKRIHLGSYERCDGLCIQVYLTETQWKRKFNVVAWSEKTGELWSRKSFQVVSDWEVYGIFPGLTSSITDAIAWMRANGK